MSEPWSARAACPTATAAGRTLPRAAGEREEATALDIGCAVGGATFELARAFPHVMGFDFSQTFVNAANVGGDRVRGLWGLLDRSEEVPARPPARCCAAAPAAMRCRLAPHSRPARPWAPHHAPQTMKERGWMRYTAVEEGELTVERVAVVPDDIDRRRVRFQQGDACALPHELGPVDAGGRVPCTAAGGPGLVGAARRQRGWLLHVRDAQPST